MSNLCLAGLIAGAYLIGVIATFAICAATDVEESTASAFGIFWPIVLALILLIYPLFFIQRVIYDRQYRKNKKAAEAEEVGYIDSHYDI